MIDLYNASVLDGLPDIIKNQIWAQAMAKAAKKNKQYILDKARVLPLFAAVDIQPEFILDQMALDLRVHEYSQNFYIEKKRELIKTSLSRWSKAGTKAAVEDLCSKIFGDAHVLEWYEYNGRPYFFKVTCNNTQITDKDVDAFKKAINSIKRLSVWLDNIELIMNVETFNIYGNFNVYDTTQVTFNVKGNTARYNYLGFVLYTHNKEYLG